MKISILTHYISTNDNNYQDLADIIVPQRDMYCERHGYNHIVYSGPYRAPNLYYAVQRLILLHDILFINDNSPDLVWVLNIQSIITNFSIPFHTYTDIYPKHDFFVSRDCHATNMGSFIVRRSEWTREWLMQIINGYNHIKHCWEEQAVVILHENDLTWSSRIKHLPQNTINSYQYFRYPPWNESTPGNWKKGDLVLSLPGTNLQERIKIVKSKEIQDSIIK